VIGIVGAGRWGSILLRDLVALGAEVAVVDPDGRARAGALEAGARDAVADLDRLAPCAAYLVVTPARTHARVADELLESGDAPIFVEKPFTTDVSDADDLAQRGNGRVFALEKWRYHSGVQLLAQVARDGALGVIEVVRTTRIDASMPIHDVDPVWTLLPHDLSIVATILGRLPEPVAATAERDAGGELAGLIGHLGDGTPSATVEVSACRSARRRSVEVVGTTATALLPSDDAPDVEVTGTDGTRTLRALADGMPTRRMMAAVLAQLTGGPPLPSATEAARSVATISELRRLAGAGDDD
jgi:predicted dehydrogenase